MKYSIKAHLRTDRKNEETGKCPVIMIVIINGKPLKLWISDQHIHPDVWDKKKGLVDIGKTVKTVRYRESKSDYEELNDFILHQISIFRSYMFEQIKLEKSVTPDKVREFFKTGKPKCFFRFWDEQIELNAPRLKPSTLLSYEDTKKILKLFRPNLEFGDFNFDLIQRFDNYLSTKRNNSPGGKFNRHKKAALRRKHITEYPYQDFRVAPARGNRKHLTFEEVVKLKELILSKEHQNLNDVKNMFLFSCVTGLRFSDVQNLKWKNVLLEAKKLEIKVVKTSNNLKVALIPDALEILAGLKGFHMPESFVFKRITNQAINRSLKTIMKEAGIEKKMTYHCSRHTFATVHLELGTSLYQVKDLLGHASIDDTQIYAKNLQSSVDASMNRFGEMFVSHVSPNLEKRVVSNL